MKFIVLAVIALVGLFNYNRFRDYRYPAFLASALWMGVLTLYFFSPIPIDSISVLTLLIFLAVVLAFTGGAELALLLYPPPPTDGVRPCLRVTPKHPRARTLLLLVSILTFPVMLAKANALAQQSGFSNWFVGLRIETSDVGQSPYGVLANITIISFITTFLFAIEVGTQRRDRLQYYCSIVVSVAYAILTTGRASVLLLFVTLLGISSMRNRLKIKTLALVACCSVLVFATFAVILGKGGTVDSPISDNVQSVKESLTQYAIGGIPAFDRIVRADPTFSYGTHTFIVGVNLVRRITGGPLMSAIQDEVDVPFPWNVYTAAQQPFEDFGIVGVIVAFVAIGCISTYWFLKAAEGNDLYICYYAISLYPLVMMAFADQYFVGIGSWLKYMFVTYMYFRVGNPESRTNTARLNETYAS